MSQADTLPSRTVVTSPMPNAAFRSPSMTSRYALFWASIGMVLLTGCHSTQAPFVLVNESKYKNIDHTCETIQIELKKRGFNCKGVLNLTESMAGHGVTLEREVRVVQFGKTEYARDMVMASAEVSALMPCSFGVYEDDGGRVFVATVNRKIVGEAFGGTVTERMRTVSHDILDILNSVCIPGTRSQRQASKRISRADPWCETQIGEHTGR